MRLHIENIALTLDRATFRFDTEVTKGITGLFGPSGAGKTTLLNVICGLSRPASGRLALDDEILFDSGRGIFVPPHKRGIGVVFQEHALFPHLTVKQNLRFSDPYLGNKQCIATMDAVVDVLDLAPLLGKRPGELSGGERQRVAIGRTLLAGPRLLLLDEPFSNLDRARRRQITTTLLHIHTTFGIPLLIISHDLEDILKMTRSLLIIENGRITAAGDYLDIANAGSAPEVITHKRFINTLELRHTQYHPTESINTFTTEESNRATVFITNSNLFQEEQRRHKRARLCIFPDDIALSRTPVARTSIQNQIPGKVVEIQTSAGSAYVTVDCGVPLVAEITPSSMRDLDIAVGESLYCLIKAKAIDVIHVEEGPSQTGV